LVESETRQAVRKVYDIERGWKRLLVFGERGCRMMGTRILQLAVIEEFAIALVCGATALMDTGTNQTSNHRTTSLER
jgi:hypothetical protein